MNSVVSRLHFPHRLRLGAVVLLATIALGTAPSSSRADTVVSDLNSPFTAIDFLNPNYGFAQEFNVVTGNWDILVARVRLGNQDPFTPATPIVEIRDTAGAGGRPGSLLGSFAFSALGVPTGTNYSVMAASPDSSFTLGTGSYWFCVLNQNVSGGFVAAFTDFESLAQEGIAGNVLNNFSRSFDGGLTYTEPGPLTEGLFLEIEAQVVPEPNAGALLLLALGAGVSARRHFRRRK